MRFVYDLDSIYVTDQIVGHLNFFGYSDAADDVADALSELEADIPSLLQRGRDLLNAGDIPRAIALFFFEPGAPRSLAAMGRGLLETWEADPAGKADVIAKTIEMAATMVEERDFRVNAPLNVLAALDVLFNLVVLRRRNYGNASEIFEKVLGVQLHMVDEYGDTYYGPREHELSAEDEHTFWKLFDTVVEEWGLDSYRRDEPTQGELVGVEGFFSAGARSAAFGALRRLAAEREVA